jgi:hypothetical protein
MSQELVLTVMASKRLECRLKDTGADGVTVGS